MRNIALKKGNCDRSRNNGYRNKYAYGSMNEASIELAARRSGRGVVFVLPQVNGLRKMQVFNNGSVMLPPIWVE
jgi:hypothetical protein